MTGPVFSISPAVATAPAPVTLRMPGAGYRAVASVTDPCGHPLHGATVRVTGSTVTWVPPHGWHGTAYVDWTITSLASPPASGARVSMILASKQTAGHPSSCKTGPSPYGHHTALGASVPVGHTQAGIPVTVTAAGGVVLALALIVTVLWRKLAPRGAHRM